VTVELLAVFLLLGSTVGFMAGLLGIGGGGILVPVLTSIFLWQGVGVENVVHLALGTSMASIIMTSFASMRAHHARGGVIWHVVKSMAPGIVLGTLLSTFIVSHISSFYLAIIFSMFMAYVAIQMFLDKKPLPGRKLVGRADLALAGGVIGGVSALVSIGGGTLTVPYLMWQNVDIKRAIGTSAAVALPISMAGTLGYVIHGWNMPSVGDYSLGFIDLRAVLLISLASFLTAPYGAKCASRLNVAVLKKIFALLLIVLSIKMLVSVST